MSMSVANRSSRTGSSNQNHNKNAYESNESSSEPVMEGGIYRQKLFEQLRQQKYNHTEENSAEED